MWICCIPKPCRTTLGHPWKEKQISFPPHSGNPDTRKWSISKFKIEPPKHDNSGKTGEDKSTQRESDAEPVAVVPEEDVEVLDNDDYLL